MQNPALEVLFILLLILTNGSFALAEIAIVTARKPRLQQRADGGDPAAHRALELANDPNRFLSTVQIGITLIGVLAGAFGGATLARALAGYFAGFPALERWASALGLAIVVVGITYLALVFGELVPKRIALTQPERIAKRVAGPLHALSRLATPLVRLLGLSTDFVLRLLKIREPDEHAATEEDIRLLLEQGTRAGVFHAAEQNIVENVFWLGDQRVGSVMTPRHRIDWLDVNDPPEEHVRTMVERPQTRYVVSDGELDRVVGVVAMKELWPQTLAGRPLDVRASATPPLFVPESSRALALLEQFRDTHVHVALVVNEYGVIQGMVTLTDILEGLVGELEQISEPGVVQREDGSWLMNGSVRMDEVRELFGLPRVPLEEQAQYRTLGGFLMTRFGRVPSPAEHVEWEGCRFEIIDLDGTRIDKVLVSRLAAPPGDAGRDAL